jgi:PIN domain nuclease of toxin-antitoxin system
MRLLLDTVTFIWAVISPERISRRSMSALQNAESLREISSISISEIAIKESRNKLAFDRDKMVTGMQDLRLHVLPYTSDHALQLFDLPLHHTDPFDRMLIAQALSEGIPIITCDEKFRLYEGLKIIW